MMRSKRASIRFIENSFKLYEQKMYQVAYSVLHDQGLAEDAVQEAFVKLMKHNVYFEDLESDECKRYMITVIKHSSIDIYNKKRKEREKHRLIYSVNIDTPSAQQNSHKQNPKTHEKNHLPQSSWLDPKDVNLNQ